jgi:calcineurin-like phosphoesterase family protein
MHDKIGDRKLLFSLLVASIITVIALTVMLVWVLRSEPIAIQEQTTTNQKFTFAAIGDFDTTSAFKDNLAQINTNKTDFTLTLGDFSYAHSTERQWCDTIHSVLGPTYPFELIPGNHDDDDGSNMADYAECLPNHIPTLQGEYGRQYFFDYKDIARIIAISPDVTVRGETYQYVKGSAQYQWLSDRIDEGHKNNIPWTIVAMHKNCLTIGGKSCEIGQDVLDLLVDKRVDLILQGHEHAYFRTSQLLSNDACPSTMPTYNEKCVANTAPEGPYQQGEGAILVINGTGGAPIRNAQLNNPLKPYFVSIHAPNNDPVHGPSLFTLTSESISAKLVNTAGQTKDQFTITAKRK